MIVLILCFFKCCPNDSIAWILTIQSIEKQLWNITRFLWFCMDFAQLTFNRLNHNRNRQNGFRFNRLSFDWVSVSGRTSSNVFARWRKNVRNWFCWIRRSAVYVTVAINRHKVRFFAWPWWFCDIQIDLGSFATHGRSRWRFDESCGCNQSYAFII